MLVVALCLLEGDGGHLRLAGDWLELNLAEHSWELRDLLEDNLSRQGALLKRASQEDGCGTQANSTDFCLMDSGLERQVLTICLEMQSWVVCFSTMCIMPVGLVKTEMCS